jgi:AcrR family transcriptional regulator
VGRIAGVTAEETRQRLLAAAGQVFVERGYERATIADIAKAAGLSSGAIYAHYRSKAELLAEAIRTRSTDAVSRMLRADPDLSIPDILFALGAALPRGDRRPNSLLIEAVIAAQRDPELAAALTADFTDEEARLATALLEAQERGELNPGAKPAAIARFCLIVGLGSAVVRLVGLPPIDDDDWQRFMDGLVRGLRTKQPASGATTAGHPQP